MTRDPEGRRDGWLGYLRSRRGTYEWRCLRYAAVADALERLGLDRGDLIVDCGAGMCDFDRYLRQARNFDGRYLPVDAAIDGVDLNSYQPKVPAEFFVAIETIEHLRDPGRLIRHLTSYATKGVVLTTPNPDVVDVLAIDRTHISPVTLGDLRAAGFEASALRLFGGDKDTIVASWQAHR